MEEVSAQERVEQRLNAVALAHEQCLAKAHGELDLQR
jgi:hypothetical protein